MLSQKIGIQRLVSFLVFALSLCNNYVMGQGVISSDQEKFYLYSEILKENREIIINLPDDYNSSKKHYPILLILDAEGERRFNLSITGYVYYSGVRRLPKMIIAGIPNTNRKRDLSPYKIKQREFSGGGEKFLNFISEELIPYLNSNYRTAEYKILFWYQNT